MRPCDTPGFKELLAEWNRKLREACFDDIIEENPNLTGTERRFLALDPIEKEAQAQYFEIIHKKIQRTHFPNELEKQILYFYAEGIEQKEIKEKLNIPGHRKNVYEPIHRWLKAWGLKTFKGWNKK